MDDFSGAPPPPMGSAANPLLMQPPSATAMQLALGQAEEDDKSKVSRWQIGSNSLNVLEQVYTMDPFPGARLRPS